MLGGLKGRQLLRGRKGEGGLWLNLKVLGIKAAFRLEIFDSHQSLWGWIK
jgi:hypothetical protein